jgi:hypothetical protein
MKVSVVLFGLLLYGSAWTCDIDSSEILRLDTGLTWIEKGDTIILSIDSLLIDTAPTRQVDNCTLVVYSLVRNGYREVSESILTECPGKKPGCLFMHWATLTKEVPAYDTVIYFQIPIPCKDKKAFGVEVR